MSAENATRRASSRAAVAVAVALSVMLCAAGATAQQSAGDQEAQIHFQSGRLHYERGDYEQALTEFQSAHSLSGRPALLYNIYLCQQSLGQNAAAAATLERYLAEGEITAQERPTLEARLENLRRRAREQGDGAAGGGDGGGTGAGATPAPAAPESGHRHTGLFARLTFGISFVDAGVDTSLGRLHLSGGGTGGGLALGWAFWENLALQVEAWGAGMVGGTIELGGLAVRDTSTKYNTAALGLGATYWFMPLNLYVSLSVGGALASAERGGTTSESKPGIGLALAVGKEFWIADEWGLGAALGLYWLNTTETQSSGTGPARSDSLNAFVVSLMGSLTFN